MLRRSDTWYFLTMGIVFMVLISAPYIWAYQLSGSDHFFGGFLFNPIDGNSYLAKMYQGWSGNWLAHLPYTSQYGGGAYLFLFYLALGHLARITGLSLQLIFHVARLIGSLVLLITLWSFYKMVLPNQRSRWLAFGLALFSSGLGWLTSLFGAFTADFWVAEGYPFLSAYANPHFPLGMAIMIWILTPRSLLKVDVQGKFGLRHGIILFVLSLLLGIILPFGVVVAGIVLGGLAFWECLRKLRSLRKTSSFTGLLLRNVLDSSEVYRLIWFCLGGLPPLIYEIWIIHSNPVFSVWNSQNITISPPFWDLLVSFAPVLILGLLGGWFIWYERNFDARILIVWSCLGFLLIYMPLGLQRRFILGYLIPLAGLAGIGLDSILRYRRRLGLAVVIVVFVFALPTNVMVLLGGVQAITSRNPSIYLTRGEKEALDWIKADTPQNSLVLASPQMGLYIPAYTGRRVLYGHPFETINADEMEAAVLLLLQGKAGEEEFITNESIDYLFFGPRERELNVLPSRKNVKLVFSSNGTDIYQFID